jgi:hypothetical protein
LSAEEFGVMNLMAFAATLSGLNLESVRLCGNEYKGKDIPVTGHGGP